MPVRQTWKTKIRGVIRLFNSSSTKAARNEELDFTSSIVYSDDSDDYDSDKEFEIKRRRVGGGGKKGPLSIKSVSSSSDNNTISSNDLQECIECGKMRTFNWCKNCESKEFIKNFSNWSSKNDLLDKFIKNTQYKAYNHRYYWEWIPFEKFSNLQYLFTSGGNIFTAVWVEGPRNQWDNDNMIFIRRKWCKVILKRLPYSSKNISCEFINELRKYYGHQRSRCSRVVQIYGLTQDPKTGRYMLVTAYHNKLDIRTLLQESKKLSWSDKLRLLRDCAEALLDIHSKGHVHKNFHPGNLLLHSRGKNIFLNISDLGLCNPYNSKRISNRNSKRRSNNYYNNDNIINNDEIIGVIPYVAPEILSCWPYTQDSDIYGFSMLMYELATGKPPFYDRAHDQHLIFDICEGLRPNFDESNIPECYKELMEQCWDTEPVNRPNANEILFIINNWDIEDFHNIKFKREDFEIHPDAIYNSRPLGELISRKLEIQDQFWEEAGFSAQDDDDDDDEMEESSENEKEEEEENDDDDDDSREHEYEHESNDDDEKMLSSEHDSEHDSDYDSEHDSDYDSEHEDDNLDSKYLVKSNEINKFQLKLDLNFGESLMSDSKDDDNVDDIDDEEDDDSLTESSSNNTNDTNSPNMSVFDDETNNTNSLNTSLFEDDMKHDDDDISN